MIDLYAAAVEMQDFFRSKDWRFCIIGGLALARWGEPRATRDVDISLFPEIGTEEDYIDETLARFSSRISDARTFALQHRILLLKATNNVAVDVALASFPFEEAIIERATPFEFDEGVELITASAEDLLVLKAFASRPQDWIDVESIVVRQAAALDWDAITEQLAALGELTGDSEVSAKLDEIRQRCSE